MYLSPPKRPIEVRMGKGKKVPWIVGVWQASKPGRCNVRDRTVVSEGRCTKKALRLAAMKRRSNARRRREAFGKTALRHAPGDVAFKWKTPAE